MALQQYTNLNFEDIKTSIKDYLRENSNFTDMDFDGSNLSVLINLLAYNSYQTAYNTNMVVNETFIDSATLRENVVSLARNIGYVPRSKRAAKATVDYYVSGLASTVDTISFAPGVIANGEVSGSQYIFSIPETVTGTATDGESEGTIEIFQGQYLQAGFVVDGSDNQRYILPNEGIDTSTIIVKIRENASSSTQVEYKLVDNILGITSTSNIYLIQETTDEKYELLFGDDVFGMKLDSGNIINVSYIKTEGVAGNGAQEFKFAGTLRDSNSALLDGYSALLTPQTPSQNGDNIEPTNSVRYYAPRLYSSQHRAVTASDYEAIIPSVYPNIESVSAYGGEELDPPQYGRVYVAAKPKNGSFLSNFTKKEILASLKSYSVAGIVPTFVDLKFIYVEIDSYIYYNPNFAGDPDTVKSSVVNSLNQFASGTELNKFGGRFKYSKILSMVDNVNNSITSNITNVRIRRNLLAKVNQFTQYELCFLNSFYCNETNYNIKSTGFSVRGISGTCYFTDEKIDHKKGKLFLFQILTDDTINVLDNNFGTVDYEKGEIIIDTVNITSTTLTNNIIEVQAVPDSNDVLARNELYLQFAVDKSNFYMRRDSISSGENTSGTRFNIQSSYQTGGSKVRGTAIISNSANTNSSTITTSSTSTTSSTQTGTPTSSSY
tara:strand:+ start:374 stop:2362 length:1989 start_codon:yes stop_codon:yes gene_type:complete